METLGIIFTVRERLQSSGDSKARYVLFLWFLCGCRCSNDSEVTHRLLTIGSPNLRPQLARVREEVEASCSEIQRAKMAASFPTTKRHIYFISALTAVTLWFVAVLLILLQRQSLSVSSVITWPLGRREKASIPQMCSSPHVLIASWSKSLTGSRGFGQLRE